MRCHQPICKLDATEVFYTWIVLCAVRILQEGKQLFCNNKNSKFSLHRHCLGSFNFIISDSAYLKISRNTSSPLSLACQINLHSALLFLKEAGGSVEILEQSSSVILYKCCYGIPQTSSDIALNINGIGLDQQGHLPFVQMVWVLLFFVSKKC